MVWTEDAPQLLELASAKSLRFCILSQTIKCPGEEALCDERALVDRPNRAGPRGERRPQEHRRLRALSELEKRASQVEAVVSTARCSGPSARVCTSRIPRFSRAASACSPASLSAVEYAR